MKNLQTEAMRRPERATDPEVRKVLEIIASSGDRELLRRTLQQAGWETTECMTVCDAQPFLSRFSVIVCDEQLPDGNWKDVLKQLQTLPTKPSLIVTSHLADERLWAEVLNLGGYDLLIEAVST